MVKKHISSSKKNSKENKTMTILGVLLGLIIIGVIIFGAYQLIDTSKNDLNVYNGFAFERRGSAEQEYWVTYVELDGEVFEVPFYNHPTDLETFVYDDRITHYFLDLGISEIILAVHPDVGSVPVLAGVNIARITGKFYGIPTKSALYVPEGENYDEIDLEKVNCNDATGPKPIIWLTNTTIQPSVVLSDDEQFCIYVSGEGENVLAAADLMAYKLLGIMK